MTVFTPRPTVSRARAVEIISDLRARYPVTEVNLSAVIAWIAERIQRAELPEVGMKDPDDMRMINENRSLLSVLSECFGMTPYGMGYCLGQARRAENRREDDEMEREVEKAMQKEAKQGKAD